MTLLTRIEAILNSRPLTPLSSDPLEVDSLTPGNFLIGGPLLSLPEPAWNETPSNLLSRWQLVQATAQRFWRRWTRISIPFSNRENRDIHKKTPVLAI